MYFMVSLVGVNGQEPLNVPCDTIWEVQNIICAFAHSHIAEVQIWGQEKSEHLK